MFKADAMSGQAQQMCRSCYVQIGYVEEPALMPDIYLLTAEAD
jgi:hypothetical protein